MIPVEIIEKHTDDVKGILEFIKENTDRPVTRDIEHAIWCFYVKDSPFLGWAAQILIDYYGSQILRYSFHWDLPHVLIFKPYKEGEDLYLPLHFYFYRDKAGHSVPYYSKNYIPRTASTDNFHPSMIRQNLTALEREKLRDAIEILERHLNEEYKSTVMQVPIYFEEALLLLLYKHAPPVYKQIAYSSLRHFCNVPFNASAANNYCQVAELFAVPTEKGILTIGSNGFDVAVVKNANGDFESKKYEEIK